MTLDLDALLAQAEEITAAIEPDDVEVVLGDQLITVRIPYVRADRFELYPPTRKDLVRGLTFSIDETARNYPGITLLDGDDEDDLRVIRGDAIVYRWPEIYDRLSFDGRETIQASIWSMHINEPEKLKQNLRESHV